ncbi:pre-mRNA cleavage complex 2 protein Pcf11-like isoform X1 [Cloeon dipterum]|uniref:pre-mRNA cleavage complex 2 protein Pcf11-like isoform X1 n=1 Tax=Cloeon dipterum TaxID=197152 RepID=UPI003220619C
MELDRAGQEVIKEFRSSLADLVVNSRPLIQMLTMLADENKSIAPAIVDAVEKQLAKADPKCKLPVFYLIDSICKNVKKVYIDLFMTNLVTNFCNVFEEVDEKTRASLFKLRNSWTDIFPATKLYALDARVQLLDPAWPIAQLPVSKASKASSIHVNPKFLQGAPDDLKNKDLLLKKKQELLKLQEKKVALELLQARASAKQTAVPATNVTNLTKSSADKQRKAPKPVPMLLGAQSILLKPNVAARPVIRPATMTAARPPEWAATATSAPLPAPAPLSPSKDPRLERAKARLEEKKEKESSSKKKSDKGSEKSEKSSKSSSSRSSSSSPGKSCSKKESKKSGSKGAAAGSASGADGLFKEVKSVHLRNYKRRARSVSSSPEPPADSSKGGEQKNKPTAATTSAAAAAAAAAMELDIDLRKLESPPAAKKRPNSPDASSSPKRSKHAEMLDHVSGRLFGHEDVDLRQIAGSRSELKRAPDWARFKESNPDSYRSPLKNCNWENGSDVSLSDLEPQQQSQQPAMPKIDAPAAAAAAAASAAPAGGRRSGEFDSLGRPLLCKLSEEGRERRRSSEDVDLRALLAEPADDAQDNSEKINLMIAQADEQLNNGTLNMTEYKALLRQVVQLNEASKLREAQRRDEQENWQGGGSPWQDEDSRDSGKASPEDQNAREGTDRRPRRRDDDGRSHDVDERFPSQRRDYQPHRRFNRGGGRWNNNNNNNMNNWGDSMWGGPRPPFQRGGPPRPYSRPPDFGHPPPPRFWGQQQFGGGRGGEQFQGTSRPPPNRADLPPPDPRELALAKANYPRDLVIDGLSRMVRYYGDETFILLSYDDPREVSFFPEERTIEFENGYKVTMMIGSPPKDVMIGGSMHRIKLGAPTRELNIDGVDYSCYFGGAPIQIELNGRPMRVQLHGPPPRVKIGEFRRTDYCAGKITMSIDAMAHVPVFLDATHQLVQIGGVPHVIRFVDSLRRVLINGQPFVFDYGGLPQPVWVHGHRHYIGLTALPPGLVPGRVILVNMEGGRLPSPPQTAQPPQEESHVPALPMIGAKSSTSVAIKKGPLDKTSEPRKTPLTRSILNTKPHLDVLSNLIPSAPIASSSSYSYQSHKDKEADKEAAIPALPADLAELMAKLTEHGFIQSANAVEGKKKEEVEKKEQYKPVTFAPESLKTRQTGAYAGLYCGIQCSTCGLRFAPEQTLKYSQHLDWHFRQNRRDKDSAKKAQSRKWYYDVSDWIQFEEIEDLEERAQSLFETQAEEEKAEEGEVEVPSVAATENEEHCEVCHEHFENFFAQDKEEWHLRDAVRVEGLVYHPHCYQDLQNRLNNTAESTDMNESSKEEEAEEPAKVEEPESAEVAPEEEKMEVEQEMAKVEDAEEDKGQLVKVKSEPHSEDEVPEQTVKAEAEVESTAMPEVKVKSEPMDFEEEDVAPPLVQATVDTTTSELKSSIDGNVELSDAATHVAPPAAKIKITITTPAPAPPVKQPEEAAPEAETPEAEEDEAPMAPPRDLEFELKPRLRGRKLTEMPPVLKGREDSALCSIM